MTAPAEPLQQELISTSRHYRYYDLVMAAFVTVLLCSNLIGPGKTCILFGLTFGAGNLFFPISYIFGDVLTEVYGYARTRKVIWAGFIFLTLTLGSGVFFSEEIFGRPAPVTHKTVFGVISWLIFAALLVGRHVYGWRGRVAVRWTLAGFLALVLAYIGSRFVLEVVLGRS